MLSQSLCRFEAMTVLFFALAINGCGRADSTTTVLSSASSVRGYTTPTGDDVPAPVRGDLLFEHDFGLIRPHEHVAHTFKLTNDTSSPWTLDRVERTCICTIAKCPRSIAPGNTGDVEIAYRAGSATLDDRRVVELHFREANAPVVRFEARVAVRASAVPSRTELVFHATTWNRHATQTFEIENFSGKEWSGLSVTPDVPWATASAHLDRVAQTQHGPIQVWQACIEVDGSGLKKGRYAAAVHIQCSDDPDVGTRLPMSLELAGLLSAVPERMFFSEVGPDGVATCRVTLHCAGCTADELATRVWVSHDLGEALTLNLVPRSSKVLELRGTLHLPEAPAVIEGIVALEVRGEVDTRIDLPLMAAR